MKLAVLKEREVGEKRVALTPETAKKLAPLGIKVMVETEAGLSSGILDSAYKGVGAEIFTDSKTALKDVDVVICVRRPDTKTLAGLKKGAAVVGMLSPTTLEQDIAFFQKNELTLFTLEWLPRITRAQAMDVLSSQSNLAGYRSVIEAAHAFGRAFPMFMTAAGTILPAKVLILGAGVAGLQAIATAKRLGAVVSAFDVRAVAKEQVESLGAKFIEVPAEENLETSGGYAKEMSDNYKRRQAERLEEALKEADIVITTALIPGKPAPRLITKEMMRHMKPGSVVVDLAAEAGGNCEATEPGHVAEFHHIKVLGYTNWAARIPADASALYARNVLSFMALLFDEKKQALQLDSTDELLVATRLTHQGTELHQNLSHLASQKATEEKPKKKAATPKKAAVVKKSAAVKKAPATKKPAAAKKVVTAKKPASAKKPTKKKETK